MIFSITLSISCALLMYSSSTALTCLQTAALSSVVTAAKCCSASCWKSPSLKVTFFAAILAYTITKNCMGFKSRWWGGSLITVCACSASKQSVAKVSYCGLCIFMRSYSSACHVGAVPYTTLIQPEQHFTFSGIAGWVPVELYIVVRRILDNNNWCGLQIWNELLQPFHIICVVHIVVVISTFWTRYEY